MKPALLDLLVCPACRGRLDCEPTLVDGPEIEEGTLRCGGCRAAYPIRAGVPRMVPAALTSSERATAHAFGTEWKMLAELSDVFRDEFRSYLEPLSPADLRGLAVLDAGCGMGK